MTVPWYVSYPMGVSSRRSTLAIANQIDVQIFLDEIWETNS